MPTIDTHAPGSFCWFELGSSNPVGAKAFYGGLFGWSAEDSLIGPDEVYSTFRLKGRDVAATYSLRTVDRERGIPPHWMPYIAVCSADEIVGRIKDQGGTVLAGPLEVMNFGRMAAATDPTGARFCVWEPREHPGTGIAAESGTECWADLIVPEPDRAMAFYAAVFGWTYSGGGHAGYQHIQNGEDYIGGVQIPDEHTKRLPPHWLLYFAVTDVDAAAAHAKESGATIRIQPTDAPGAGRYALVFDPQGASFALWRSSSSEN